MKEEIWKPLPGYDGDYEISNLGRIKSNVRLGGGIMKATVDASGYPTVEIRGKNKRVHELVLAAFNGGREGTEVGMHANGNKNDNSLKNLSWGSRAENEKGPRSSSKKSDLFESIVGGLIRN
jgi:hypothetical protein